MSKDNLVLYAGGKGIAELRAGIKLKYAGLARYSGALFLFCAPSLRSLKVAAEDMERDLILGAHGPAGTVYVKIELGSRGSEAGGSRRVGSYNAYRHNGNDHHHCQQH